MRAVTEETLAQSIQALGYRLEPSEVAWLTQRVGHGQTVQRSTMAAAHIDWPALLQDHRCAVLEMLCCILVSKPEPSRGCKSIMVHGLVRHPPVGLLRMIARWGSPPQGHGLGMSTSPCLTRGWGREIWLAAARKVFEGIGSTPGTGRVTSEGLVELLRRKLPAEEVESAVEAAMIDAGYAGEAPHEAAGS